MKLEVLLAHEEIRQTLYRHFRAIDRLDAELARSAFWDDGRFEGGPIEGSVGDMMPELLTRTMRNLFSTTMHCAMNMLIEVENDHAFVEIYSMPFHVVPPESLESVFGKKKAAELDPRLSHELVMGVRYLVRMEQRESCWKIALMKLIVDWCTVVPHNGIKEDGVLNSIRLRGVRDRSDASYRWHS